MNCKDCGRPLKQDEDKYCPHCRNKRDRGAKIAWEIAVGVLAALGGIAGAVLGGNSKKDK